MDSLPTDGWSSVAMIATWRATGRAADSQEAIYAAAEAWVGEDASNRSEDDLVGPIRAALDDLLRAMQAGRIEARGIEARWTTSVAEMGLFGSAVRASLWPPPHVAIEPPALIGGTLSLGGAVQRFGMDVYLDVQLQASQVAAVWSDSSASLDATTTATDAEIERAISKIYQDAEQAPNLAELWPLARDALSVAGLRATKRRVQDIADLPQFKNSRRKGGEHRGSR